MPSGSVHQEIIELPTTGRGLFDITWRVGDVIKRCGTTSGLVQVFCQHTSCSLLIMENADPSEQRDLLAWFERIAPDGDPRYEHHAEGPDDMSAHLRMAITRTQETLPLCDGRLLLGTWQGLYLFEHRASPHRRKLVVTVLAACTA